MTPSVKNVLISSVAALALVLGAAERASAADQKAALEKIKAHNQAATSAYGASDFEEMKTKLLEALALGNENGLGKSKIIAQTYVLLGVLQVDGFKDGDAGVKFFAKALEISPAVQIPQGMGTKAVKAAFKRAEDEEPSDAEPELVESPKAGKGKAKAEKAEKLEKAEKDDAEAERAVQAAIDKKRNAETAAERKQAEAERKQAEAERKQAEKEKDKLMEDLAQAKVNESLGHAEKEKLQKERQERDRALADSKGRLAQLEKDKADRDKWLADTKAKLEKAEKDRADRDKQLADAKGQITQLQKDKADRDKWLADTKASEARERAAKEKLEKEKPDREKALADAKARITQLEKDKADRDSWLAASTSSEKHERAAKEKAEKALQDVASRDKERKAKEVEEKQEREKLEAGPDMPGHIAEPITCTLPDEVAAGEDLFVHCVPQPGTGAKALALYYRPAGGVVYNAVTMERSKKGWYVALIPGSRISGKLLQYYVEGRDAKEKLAASNGKASSPNIAMVKAGGVAAARRGKSR